MIRSDHRRNIADVDAQRGHAVRDEIDLDLPGFGATHLDIRYTLETLQAADDHILGETVEVLTGPVGTDMETHDRPVGALEPPNPYPLEICREPVANPVHPVADIDRGQVHIGAVDKTNADVAR